MDIKFFLHKNKWYDWEHMLNSYNKYVNKHSIVLEIGASNIEKTKMLSKYCKKLIGVEINQKRIPENFDNVHYIHGDWQYLSKTIKPDSIDIVISSHVIEHVQYDLKAINELYKVLKKGGIAILNTPNRKRLTRAFIEFFTGPRKFPYWEHVREYTEEDLLNLLKKSKFKNFKILPVVFGIYGGNIYIYSKSVPNIFKKWSNFWEIHLFK